MSPSVCSHVVLGKRHGPRLPPSAYRIPDHAPHSSIKCWKVLDHGPHGFPRIRDRDQNAFPHVLARPNIFSPEYWRDSEARRFASPSLDSGGLAQRFGRWRLWDLYKKNTIASNGRQASKARGGGGGFGRFSGLGPKP